MNYCSCLAMLKQRSLRRGLWHRVLNTLERAQVNVTIRVVKRVCSPALVKVLDAIITKLCSSLQSRVLSLIRTVGIPSAQKLSKIAQSWGNTSAKTWGNDMDFARFLGIMRLNVGS